MSDSQRYDSPRDGVRAWAASTLWAVAAMSALLAFAVVVNLFIPGRVIHWDWVAAMGVGGSAVLALARRRGIV
ncbi:MAG: hypothetical protein V3S18_02160 [Dehalococcoidia bacterium]